MALRDERIAASPQFSNGVFANPHINLLGPKAGTRGGVARRFLFGGEQRRPPAPLPAHSPLAGWARPPQTDLRVTWLGHSTMLLESGGMRILTDPVWSERISPFGFVAPRRFQAVPAAIADLPQLDVIVISHNHFDHLDAPSIRQLAPLGVPFVTPLGVGRYLEAWGVPAAQIVELDWWESTSVRGVKLTATPSQHFSGRVGGRNQTLWASFVIETAKAKIFFSGDTALTPAFGQVAKAYGPFDLVMLEVGGFDPAWDHVHLGPENALDALALLGGGRFMPIHWGTFNLALHAWDWPPETVLARSRERGVELFMPELGVPSDPARIEGARPWWRGPLEATVHAPEQRPADVARREA